MAFKLFEYQRAISDSRKLFTGEIDVTEMRTPEDVIERFFVANRSIFETRKEMLNLINSAQELGLSPRELREIFDKRGLKSDYEELKRGKFDPFFPSERLQEVFQDNARRGNVANVFLGARPTIQAMSQIMRTLSLYGDFNLNLKDFLPDTDPEGESALPPTPMPNARLLSQQNNPINNLTRTESALLSPDEKEIARRT